MRPENVNTGQKQIRTLASALDRTREGLLATNLRSYVNLFHDGQVWQKPDGLFGGDSLFNRRLATKILRVFLLGLIAPFTTHGRSHFDLAFVKLAVVLISFGDTGIPAFDKPRAQVFSLTRSIHSPQICSLQRTTVSQREHRRDPVICIIRENIRASQRQLLRIIDTLGRGWGRIFESPELPPMLADANTKLLISLSILPLCVHVSRFRLRMLVIKSQLIVLLRYPFGQHFRSVARIRRRADVTAVFLF